MASLLQRANSTSAASSSNKGKRKASDEEGLSLSSSSLSAPPRRNKQRVLILPSRGVTSQMRHLVSDLETLLPHSKRDAKLDSKSNLHILNELAELNNCNNALYFEARKHQDLYLWASKTPNGPSAKLFVQNIHTMDELKMTGNCLKGSRPVLSFDKAFDADPHWALLKEMLTQAFGVPKSSRRVKPFIDHVITFSVLDGKIWFRNYQIIEDDVGASAIAAADKAEAEAEDNKGAKKGGKGGKGKPSMPKGKTGAAAAAAGKQPTMVEIGPRFVMTPIRIFEGSFGGATLYENPEYISPNAVRHAQRHAKGTEYKTRSRDQDALQAKVEKLAREKAVDELATDRVFA